MELICFMKIFNINSSLSMYFYLNSASSVLTRTQKESSIDEWVTVEDMQRLLAQSARNARLVLSRQCR